MQVTIKAQKIVEICDKTIAELKELEDQSLKKSKELGRLYAEQYLVFEKEMNEYRDYIRYKDKWEKSSRLLRGDPPTVKTRPADIWLYRKNYVDNTYIDILNTVESFRNKVKHADEVVLTGIELDMLVKIEHKFVKQLKEQLLTTAQEDFDKVMEYVK